MRSRAPMWNVLLLTAVALMPTPGCATPSGARSPSAGSAAVQRAPIADVPEIRASWFIDNRRAPIKRVLARGWRGEFELYTAHAVRTGCNAILVDLPMCGWHATGGPSIIRPAAIDWAEARAPRLADIDGPSGLAAGIELALRSLDRVIIYEGSLWSTPGTPAEHAERLRRVYAPLKQRFGDRLLVLLDQGGMMAMEGVNRYPTAKNAEVSRELVSLFESGVIDGGELPLYRNHPYFSHATDASIQRRWWTAVVETGIDNNTRAFSAPLNKHTNPRLCLVRCGLDDHEPGEERKRLGREWIRLAQSRGWSIAAATRYWDGSRDTWASIVSGRHDH